MIRDQEALETARESKEEFQLNAVPGAAKCENIEIEAV